MSQKNSTTKAETGDGGGNRSALASAHDLRQRIVSRWSTREAFYAARDDRTVRVAGLQSLAAYAELPVEIHVDPAMLHDVTVQRIALVATNLTVRWARRVRVVMDGDEALAEPLRRGDAVTLRERLELEMAMADPFGDRESAGVTEVPLRLFIGPWRGTRLGADDFQVDAESWCALGRRGGDQLTARMHSNVGRVATAPAAALAGALGAGDLFKRAVGHERGSWLRTFAWDTWSSTLVLGEDAWRSVIERRVPKRLALGRVLLAGVGAIGSAMLYIIDMMDPTGQLTLFDRDAVDVTNLNRAPLFTVLDAFEDAAKTAVGKRWLARHEGRGMELVTQDGVWREHMSKLADEPFDVWVSLTNEDGAWADVPFELPPVVLHGTTTSGWGFGAGRHIPRLEDCTLCRMPRPEAVFRGPCAEGVITTPVPDVTPVRASLPFLSAASAALVVGSMLQLQDGGADALQLANDMSVDLSTGLPAVVALKRAPTPACSGCAASRTRAWMRRGGRGRYAVLSCPDAA